MNTCELVVFYKLVRPCDLIKNYELVIFYNFVRPYDLATFYKELK